MSFLDTTFTCHAQDDSCIFLNFTSGWTKEIGMNSGKVTSSAQINVNVLTISGIYVGLSIESMHYMMSSTLYRVHWSEIHYTESRSPLSFDQLHPAAQSPIRSTLFLQVPYSRSRSPVYPVTPSCVLCPKEKTPFQFCLPHGSAFLSSLQPWLPVLLCSC